MDGAPDAAPHLLQGSNNMKSVHYAAVMFSDRWKLVSKGLRWGDYATLDEAMMAGLSEVNIIHGKGTGKLRSAIQEHLRHHPHVKAFRLGRYGEGEDGVTVVTLNQ